TGRHLEHDVGARRAGALLAHAVLAASRLEMLAVAVVDERIEAGHGLRHHVAAAAAVAAPWAARLDEFLAPECDAAVPAVAGPDVDLGLVEKFHGPDIEEAELQQNAGTPVPLRFAACSGHLPRGPLPIPPPQAGEGGMCG